MGGGRGGGMMMNNMGGGGFGGGGMMMGGGRGGYNNMGGMGRGGMGGMMGGGMGMMQQQVPSVPNPYVSLAMLSESCSLLGLFNLLECWGAVLWLKRNQKNKKIVVAKMASAQEAAAVSMNLKNVPFYDMFLSGRTFPQFNERSDMEPKEEGDPSDPSVETFNFMTRTHRPAAWRSKTPATFCVALGNFSNSSIDESAITSYLNELGIQFQSVSKDASSETPVFNVICNDVSNAAKLVARGQANVCKDEKSQTKFIEPPTGAQPIASASAPAPTPTSSATPTANNGGDNNTSEQQQQQQQQQQTEEQQAQEVAAATAEESGAATADAGATTAASGEAESASS